MFDLNTAERYSHPPDLMFDRAMQLPVGKGVMQRVERFTARKMCTEVRNFSCHDLASYQSIGLVVDLPAVPNATGSTVDIIYSVHGKDMYSLLLNYSEKLSPWLTPDMKETLTLYQKQTMYMDFPMSMSVTFTIPIQTILDAEYGVYIELIDLVICKRGLMPAMKLQTFRNIVLPKDEEILRYLWNDHDPKIKTLYGVVGRMCIEVATNVCNRQEPEGLRIVTWKTDQVTGRKVRDDYEIKPDEMLNHGYHYDLRVLRKKVEAPIPAAVNPKAAVVRPKTLAEEIDATLKPAVNGVTIVAAALLTVLKLWQTWQAHVDSRAAS